MAASGGNTPPAVTRKGLVVSLEALGHSLNVLCEGASLDGVVQPVAELATLILGNDPESIVRFKASNPCPSDESLQGLPPKIVAIAVLWRCIYHEIDSLTVKAITADARKVDFARVVKNSPTLQAPGKGGPSDTHALARRSAPRHERPASGSGGSIDIGTTVHKADGKRWQVPRVRVQPFPEALKSDPDALTSRVTDCVKALRILQEHRFGPHEAARATQKEAICKALIWAAHRLKDVNGDCRSILAPVVRDHADLLTGQARYSLAVLAGTDMDPVELPARATGQTRSRRGPAAPGTSTPGAPSAPAPEGPQAVGDEPKAAAPPAAPGAAVPSSAAPLAAAPMAPAVVEPPAAAHGPLDPPAAAAPPGAAQTGAVPADVGAMASPGTAQAATARPTPGAGGPRPRRNALTPTPVDEVAGAGAGAGAVSLRSRNGPQ